MDVGLLLYWKGSVEMEAMSGFIIKTFFGLPLLLRPEVCIFFLFTQYVECPQRLKRLTAWPSAISSRHKMSGVGSGKHLGPDSDTLAHPWLAVFTLVALQWGGMNTGPCVLISHHQRAGWSRYSVCCGSVSPSLTASLAFLFYRDLSRACAVARACDVTDATIAAAAGGHPSPSLTPSSSQGGIAIPTAGFLLALERGRSNLGYPLP